MKPNRTYLRLLGISGIVFLILRLPYRSYIYEHDIFDFYIADTAPNFLVVFMFVFLRRSHSSVESALMLATMSGLGVLGYEFIQGKTILFFDWRDVTPLLLRHYLYIHVLFILIEKMLKQKGYPKTLSLYFISVPKIQYFFQIPLLLHPPGILSLRPQHPCQVLLLRLPRRRDQVRRPFCIGQIHQSAVP